MESPALGHFSLILLGEMVINRNPSWRNQTFPKSVLFVFLLVFGIPQTSKKRKTKEKNCPVPPSPLFRNDAAALPPRHFRSVTCYISLYKKAYIKTYKKNTKTPFVNPLLKSVSCAPPPVNKVRDSSGRFL